MIFSVGSVLARGKSRQHISSPPARCAIRFYPAASMQGLPDPEACFSTRLEQAQRGISQLAALKSDVIRCARLVQQTLGEGRSVLTCGNGGSAAEALHFAEELSGRYRSNRQALAAISLSADPTALTCIANDFGFERVFSRQVEAIGRKGDALVVLSTSGKSANILLALETARARGLRTVGLLGGDGGKAAPLCDVALVVRAVDGAAVQEIHQMIIHIICESLEPIVV